MIVQSEQFRTAILVVNKNNTEKYKLLILSDIEHSLSNLVYTNDQLTPTYIQTSLYNPTFYFGI